jgi:hypothetical protein
MHPELGQRIDDRVDHRSKRRRGAALAPGSDAEPVRWRRHFAERGSQERQIVGARHSVIHKARRQQLPAPGVVMAILEQRLAHPLGNSAMRLTVQDQRVDCAADIINRSVADDPNLAGIGINLDLRPAASGRRCRQAAVAGLAANPCVRPRLRQPRRCRSRDRCRRPGNGRARTRCRFRRSRAESWRSCGLCR